MNALALVAALAVMAAAAAPAPPPGHPPVAAASGAAPPAIAAAPGDLNPGHAAAPGDTAASVTYPVVEVAPDSTITFALLAGSRLFPAWKEEHQVHIGERFLLGDTPSSAEVRRFFPAFLIVDGRRINTSRAMVNPAVQIFVYEAGAVTDSTWAFLNFPPHYSARSFFTFQLQRVDGYAGGGS